MAKREGLNAELLSAELLKFFNKSVSEMERISVKIQRIDGVKHRIVILNESSEVYSYAVDEIAQLHHVDENLVKWRGADDDSDEWNLVTFKDRNIADNFVRMVKKFSKCSLQTVETKIMHVYSSVKTELVLSEEENNVPVSSLNQMPVKVELFTTPPISSSAKSVFEDETVSKSMLPQPGESNEAMVSDSDIVTDDVHSRPLSKPAVDDDLDDIVPQSPVDTNDDGRFRSSTPTSKVPPYSAFVAGMAQNTSIEQTSGVAQNEQCNTKKKKPKKLPSIVNLQQDCATPDLSEKSTLSRVGACFFDTSRGTDDEGYHMELDYNYERYYKKVVKCYKKTLTYYWSQYPSGGSLLHKVIAALVCQNGKSCYTAVLSTGTYHNDREKCGFTSTCDGHAISICYEAAPKFFLEEIKNLINKEDSIFEYIPNMEGFRLKQGVSFHLLVTQFPCGFIRDQKEPCMEWKIPFVEYPHVPTCSSRILIGATMGIQGYISHLLDEPILIHSLIILSPDIDKPQVLGFGSAFKMPKIVRTMKYNPEDFKPGYFFPSKYSPNTSCTEHESHSNVSCESIDGNETAKSLGPGLEDAKDSCAAMATTDNNTNSVFFKFDPRSAQEISSDNEFSIKTRDVDQSLEVNEELKMERMSYLKQLYDRLASHLKLEEALVILSAKLDAEIKKKEEMMSSLLQSVSTELTEVVPDTLGTSTISIQEWDNYLRKQKTKLHHIGEEGRMKIINRNMVTCIQSILANKQNMIMDCNWHQYFNVSPSSFQPTKDEWYS